MRIIQFLFIVIFSFVDTSKKTNLKLIKQNITSEATLVLSNENQSMNLGDINVKALGKSGKISISRGKTSDANFKEVTINFSSLKEVDTNGNYVIGGGSNKHSFENFAQLDFTFSPITNLSKDGVKCNLFTFESSKIVTDLDKLKITVYIFLEDGEIDIGNSMKQKVKSGDIKFNVEVNKWPFCLPSNQCSGNTCCKTGSTYAVGQYLDLEIEMKNNDTKASTNTATTSSRVDNITFLDNSKIYLNNNIYLDNTWGKMPENYPQQKSSTSKDLFVFRFPKFTNTVLYDPVISLSSISKYVKTISMILFAFALFLF